MKFYFLAISSLLASSCSTYDYGSNCTESQIKINQRIVQTTQADIVEPFLFQEENGIVITIGRSDVFQILSNRAKVHPTVARAVELTYPILESLPNSGSPINVSTLYPKLTGLSKQQLNDAVFITNELHVLFVEALKNGSAQLSGATGSQTIEIQQYSGSNPTGKVHGVRFILGKQRILDSCYTDLEGT